MERPYSRSMAFLMPRSRGANTSGRRRVKSKNICYPFANAFDGSERLDYFLIFQLLQPVQFGMGVPGFGERHDVRHFLTAQSQCAEFADRCVQHHVRLQSTAPFSPCLKPPSEVAAALVLSCCPMMARHSASKCGRCGCQGNSPCCSTLGAGWILVTEVRKKPHGVRSYGEYA